MKQREDLPKGVVLLPRPTSLSPKLPRRSATGWRWSTAWHRHNQQPWRQQRCSGPWQGTSSRASVSQGLVAIWAVPASHGRKGRGSLGRRCQSRGCRGSRTRGNLRAPGTPTSTWGASRTQGLQPGPPKRKRPRPLALPGAPHVASKRPGLAPVLGGNGGGEKREGDERQRYPPLKTRAKESRGRRRSGGTRNFSAKRIRTVLEDSAHP